jgi:hypothetical protein
MDNPLVLLDLLERALPFVESVSTVEATRVRAYQLRAEIKDVLRAALGSAPQSESPPV